MKGKISTRNSESEGRRGGWWDGKFYSLELKCPWKCLLLLGGAENFKRWDLVGGPPVTGGMPLMGIVRSQTLPLSLLCSQSWGEQVSFATRISLDVLSQGRPKSKRVNWPWNTTSQSVNPNKPFLFSNWLSHVFCYSDGKLINTVRHETRDS